MRIPVGYAQVTHNFIGGAVPQGAVVTYGIAWPGVTPLTDITIVHGLFTANFLPLLNNSVTCDKTIIKGGPVSTGPTYEHTDPEEGGQSGEPEPPQVAYLMKKRTALGGRLNRGRFYLPGVQTSHVDLDGSVDGGQLGNLTAAALVLLLGLADADMNMVVLHGGSSTPTVVTQLLADPFVATQRRRLR